MKKRRFQRFRGLLRWPYEGPYFDWYVLSAHARAGFDIGTLEIDINLMGPDEQKAWTTVIKRAIVHPGVDGSQELLGMFR